MVWKPYSPADISRRLLYLRVTLKSKRLVFFCFNNDVTTIKLSR